MTLIDFQAVITGGVQGGKPSDDEQLWLSIFDSLFTEEAQLYDQFQAYYDGDQEITWNWVKFAEIFGPDFKSFRDNWCEVVVDACAERLIVQGFQVQRLEEESADPEAEADEEGAVPEEDSGYKPGEFEQDEVPVPEEGYNANQVREEKDPELEKLRRKVQAIWRRNRLDAMQELVYTQALVKGKSFLICWPNFETGMAEIYFHDAILIRCWYDENGELEAAAKQWRRPDNSVRRNIYFRERVEKWLLRVPSTGFAGNASEAQKIVPGVNAIGPISWEKFANEGDEYWPLENPYLRVPVIPFYNKPQNAGIGTSEIKNTIPQQNAINKTLADLLVSSEYAAFKQKVIASKGRPKEGWKHGPNQLWSTTDTDAKWGQFDETPLDNFIKSVEMWVQHVAATSRTPSHYFFTQGDAPSGESLKASEAGLVKKCEKKQAHFGTSWEDALRFALEIELGADALPVDTVIDTVWKSPETRIEREFWETQRIKKALGVPDEVLWEEGGYTPEQITEMRKINDAKQTQEIGDLLLAGFDKGTGGGAQNAMTPGNGQRPPAPFPPR